jgi:hypothetical protein
MEIQLDDKVVHLDKKIFHKMVLILNALDDGWTVKSHDTSYVFTKKHEGRRECFTDEYLTDFMRNNLDIRRVLEKK